MNGTKEVDEVTLRLTMNEPPIFGDGGVWVCDVCYSNWGNCFCKSPHNPNQYANYTKYRIKDTP